MPASPPSSSPSASSSILHADHILVLDEGREIGYGTHEQLMESCQIYREISESQMGGDFG